MFKIIATMHGFKYIVLHIELILIVSSLNSMFVLLELGFPHALQCFFVDINSPHISFLQTQPCSLHPVIT